jgi:outer membrane protein
VSAYEDEQAKERALAQSTQLTSDNRKQLEIGTLAPLDVVNSDSAVATDKQALVASKSNLEYQQLIMKQAIARNLNDPAAGECAGDSDRPRGAGPAAGRGHAAGRSGEAGVREQSADRAGVLSMKNNEITIKAEKNGLLPTVDAYAFYGASALGGRAEPGAELRTRFGDRGSWPAPSGNCSGRSGYGTALRQPVQQHSRRTRAWA